MSLIVISRLARLWRSICQEIYFAQLSRPSQIFAGIGNVMCYRHDSCWSITIDILRNEMFMHGSFKSLTHRSGIIGRRHFIDSVGRQILWVYVVSTVNDVHGYRFASCSLSLSAITLDISPLQPGNSNIMPDHILHGTLGKRWRCRLRQPQTYAWSSKKWCF